ncbi:MAG: hypothetical protein R1F52_05870 [Candidatus Nitrosoabyssus spongiisocia]|nr:MAG: hypothetical protein R1F52_05870 [Nitrosopumilaceae archaeon AB1(1)]
MELGESKQHLLIFGGILITIGIIMSTVVFPFWNLIREDVYEDVIILSNDDGICYAVTTDDIPKTIQNCDKNTGDSVTIKFGKDLAWAEIISP